MHVVCLCANPKKGRAGEDGHGPSAQDRNRSGESLGPRENGGYAKRAGADHGDVGKDVQRVASFSGGRVNGDAHLVGGS